MIAPSGEQYSIAGGGYRAAVTECGGGLRLLEYDGRRLVEGFGEQEHASAGRGQLLLPWPNRIEDGSYTFAGQSLQLPISETSRNNASHGLTRWTAWRLEEHTERSVSLGYRLMAQSGYPWTLDLQVRYEVSADGLTVTVTAANRSSSPAPYAQGAHPYLLAGEDVQGARVDHWELRLPGQTRLLTNERKIPVGREPVEGTDYDFGSARAISDLALDDAFTDLSRTSAGLAEVELRSAGAGVLVWMDQAHRWVQVYSGDDLPGSQARRSLAIEPMTAPANAFRTGEGLVELAQAGSEGDTHSSSWGIRAL